MFGFGNQQNSRRKPLRASGRGRQLRQAGTGYEKRLRFEPLEERQLLSVYTVNKLTDGPVAKAGDQSGTLRQAIFDANANPGADEIHFTAGLTGTLTLSSLPSAGQLAITDALTIVGPGAVNPITINGNNQSRIFKIDDGNSATSISVEIDGLTLTGGNAGGTLKDGSGGAISNQESLTVNNSTITGNTCTNGGGGIYGYQGTTTTIQNTTVTNNTAGDAGGGLWFSPAKGATLTIQDSTISGNTAQSGQGSGGGGIYVGKEYGAVTIRRCTISGNTAASQSGGITTLEAGGGVLLWQTFGPVTLDSDIISGNVGAGGGMRVRNSNGGAITVENCTISENTSDDGGGASLRSAGGTIIIENSTVSGNNASGRGGGLYTVDFQSITIQNSTITGNTAQTAGGLYVAIPSKKYYSPEATDIHSTIISGNTDTSGTAADLSAAPFPYNGTDYPTITVTNSLVGNNTGSNLTAAPLGSPDASGNLIGTASSPIDAKLGPLADNGGPTKTCALLAGSPAINTGANPDSLTTDQRGLARQVGSQIDMGAYEAQLAVIGISPAQGPTSGGTPVTITGVAFTGATVVKFGNTSVAFHVDSDTQITTTSPAGTGVVDVTVTTAAGTSLPSTDDHFSYTVTVTGITPAQGPVTGSTPVTITGTGFTGATAVKFGNTAAATFHVDSDTQITATSPVGTGIVDITVTGAAGTSAKSAADLFQYAPVVTAISPTQGPAAGGTQITITGVGFSGATAVKFGSTPATTFTVVSDTQVTATSPAGSGAVDVTVVTPNGTSLTSSADHFTYVAPTGISPAQGPVTGGTQVTITGTGFTGATAVKFGSTPGTSLIVSSDTQITVTSPAGTGAVNVTVTIGGGTPHTLSVGQFSYTSLVTGISPARGPATGGTPITISGVGFTGATAVKFGGNAAVSFTVVSDTQITATSPAGTGAVDVTVTTASGTSASSSADQFSYVPVVTGLSPALGPATGGTQVTITGAGFTAATAVAFGSTKAASFTVVSDTQITATSPAGKGVTDVTVTTATGTSATVSADHFSYMPGVTTLSPSFGTPAGATAVTITGAGFTGATAVNFGSTPAATFAVVSDTQITATSPAGSGVVDVTVTTAMGTSAKVSADQFSYAPTVKTVSPVQGTPKGGTQVVITGGNFTGATAVKFGSTAATSFTVNSDTQITATSPVGVGIVDVTVTGPTGTSATSSADQFSYPPLVTAISPASGTGAGNTQVTITGAGFTGATTVRFGTKTVAFTVLSDTQITATSPAGAGVVDVIVVTAGGTSVPSSADQFSYLPTVTAISVASGPTAGATQVTITGTNLSGATAVKFGGNIAAIQSNTGTQLVVISPAGIAGTVDVTVTTAGGTSATSTADRFTYVVAPVVTTIGPTFGAPAGGTQVTISGTGFTGATAVDFGAAQATSFAIVSDTQITATSPAGTGLVDVTVVTAGGTSATSKADQFGYAPQVTGISPAQGLAIGGTQVTITGTNLAGATVKFGSNTATIQSNNGAQIVVLSAAGAGGTVDVTVTTAGGTSVTSSADQFTYLAAPVVTGVSATSGLTAGGMSVTITGTNLAGATSVKFGSTSAAIQSNTATQIVVKSPAGTAGTWDVTVVTAGGTSVINSADQFTYYVANTCAIGLYNPNNSVFYLRNSNTAGFATNAFLYGAANNGLVPIIGDWDGNGTETAGLYNPATSMFYLSNSNNSQMADTVFLYGPANSGYIPIVGDWNGDSKETVGLYDPKTSTFYLRNSNTTGFGDVTFVFGSATGNLIPVAGDWYGGGIDTIGLYDRISGTFLLRNSNSGGEANVTFTYGPTNSHLTPVIGDWNAHGSDTVGLYDPAASVFYLKNSNESGFADTVFAYGAPNSGWTPLVGKWMGYAHAEMAAQQVVASPDTTGLTQDQLTPIVNQAIAQWAGAGLSAAEVQQLRQAQFVISDLPGGSLGETTGNIVALDANAAGNGWFVDPTPAQNEEFAATAGTQQMRAIDPRAVDHIDLLTVVEHELGHVLGLKDLDAATSDIMDGVLGVGTRRTASSVDAALAS